MQVNFLSTRFVSLLFLPIILLFTACSTEDGSSMKEEAEYPVYSGSDLGLSFNDEGMTVKTWSPKADEVVLLIYDFDLDSEPIEEFAMEREENGVWVKNVSADYKGKYYTLRASIDNSIRDEVPGVYAKAVGRNGRRAQFVNPAEAQPQGWEGDKAPKYEDMQPNDFLVYEVHVRDFSISESSGMENKGKFLAFTETGTTNSKGKATGVDHLKDMGVTHVHLLPSFDFFTVDETQLDEPQYNWGYDPQNYNVPEGSYSTNPADGSVRIREFKAMVQSLHKAGIGVVMDVVYNHTSRTEGLSFEELVPGYYYRQWNDSTLSDASGCGNEVASDQPMMRKFMVESLKYWMEEYHVDGFRFDLMAIHDIKTMREIEEELRAINPNVLLYGEGWTAGDSPLPSKDRALKASTYEIPGIAAFSDEIRDGLKGHWSSHESKGFVSGNSGLKESVKFGIVGGIDHPQIDYEKVNNTDTAWAAEPHQCMVYVSCHDNHTLYDKLKIANPEASEEEIRQMHLLSNFVVLTSQGVPFLHAGVEFLRTKNGVENSYKSPDEINQINWEAKTEFGSHVERYKELITLRREHSSFRLSSADEIRQRLKFIDTPDGIIAYEIAAPEDDEWKRVVVAFNGTGEMADFPFPSGEWDLVYPSYNLKVDFLKGKISPYSGYILAEKR